MAFRELHILSVMMGRENINPENMRFRWREPLPIRRSLGKCSEVVLTLQQTITIAVLVSAPILALGTIATAMRPSFGTREMVGVCVIAAMLSFTVTWLVPFVNRFLPRTITVDHRCIRIAEAISIPFGRAIGLRGSRMAPEDVQFTAIAAAEVERVSYHTMIISLRGGGDIILGIGPDAKNLELRHYMKRWQYHMEESSCDVDLPEIGSANRWNTFATPRPARPAAAGVTVDNMSNA